MPAPLRRSLTTLALACALASSTHAQSVDPTASPPPTVDNAPPRLVHFVPAAYPPQALHDGREPSVVLQLSLDAEGHVTDASVEASAGHDFDEAAASAARQFVFTPARRDGAPVAARIRYRYRFTARAVATPAPPVHALVRGTVRDPMDHAVADANVTLTLDAGPVLHAVTNADGTFRFDLDTVGMASVAIESASFRPYRAEESVGDHDDLQVIYRLVSAAAHTVPASAPASDDGPGVTVHGTRPPREVTRTTLERDEVSHVPGAGGDALRSIQNLPSVARAPALSGDLIIRGSAPGDTAIMVDGTDLPLIYHFSGATSVIPTEMLDRIDFYPGNFSVRYGRATGGIVDVGLRSPRREGCHGVAQIGTIDASLFAECGGVLPNLSIAVGLRRSWVDAILNAVVGAFTTTQIIAAPVYWDYQAVIEWRPSPNHRVRLAVLGDDDTLNVLFRNPDDSMPTVAGRFSLSTRFHIAQLSWTHDIAPGTQQRAMISAGWTGTEFVGNGPYQYSFNAVPIDVRYELSHTVSPEIRMNTGVDVQMGPTQERFVIPRLDDSNTATAPQIAANINTTLVMPAWYAEMELTPVRGLRIVPGVRLDYAQHIQRALLQPRVSARWEFVHTWTLKGGIGLFGQAPSFDTASNAPNVLIPGQTIGNPNLPYTSSMHYALGFEHAFTSLISVSVEGFYKTIDGLPIAASPFALTEPPYAAPYTGTGVGRVYGMDVLLRHRSNGRFFGWIAYTLMRSERRDTPGGSWYAFDYDQTHILTVVASYTLGWGFQVGLRFRYVTGTPTTPYASSYYNADTLLYTPVEGAHNSVRTADFHQLDLRIDKTFRFRWGSVGAFLEVLNVYNQPNQEGLQYNYNYTRNAPITGLPIFPNLGLRGEL